MRNSGQSETKKMLRGSGWQIVSSEKGKIQKGKLRFDKISEVMSPKTGRGGGEVR
jgi:hypothetical protein